MRFGRLLLLHPLYGPSKHNVYVVYGVLWWYRIEAIDRLELPNNRILDQGQRAWVPVTAVRLIP